MVKYSSNTEKGQKGLGPRGCQSYWGAGLPQQGTSHSSFRSEAERKANNNNIAVHLASPCVSRTEV